MGFRDGMRMRVQDGTRATGWPLYQWRAGCDWAPSSRLNDFPGEPRLWHRVSLCLLSHTDVWRLPDPSASCPGDGGREKMMHILSPRAPHCLWKRPELHCAVIGGCVWRRLSAVESFCLNCSQIYIHFFILFCISLWLPCFWALWDLWNFPQTWDEGRAASKCQLAPFRK